MKQRRNLDREGLEVYLLNLLLAYRPIFRISAFIVLIYSVGVMSSSVIVGSVAFVVAIFLGLASYSYHRLLGLAKIGAWVGTIRKKE
jgi:hypothetical protein